MPYLWAKLLLFSMKIAEQSASISIFHAVPIIMDNICHQSRRSTDGQPTVNYDVSTTLTPPTKRKTLLFFSLVTFFYQLSFSQKRRGGTVLVPPQLDRLSGRLSFFSPPPSGAGGLFLATRARFIPASGVASPLWRSMQPVYQDRRWRRRRLRRGKTKLIVPLRLRRHNPARG